MAADAADRTVVDARADIEGKMSGKDAHVLGRFRGEITLSGKLVVGEGARVEAKVKVESAEVSGEFKGDLSAETLVVLDKAKIEGTVAARRLAIREGATVNGSISAGESGTPGGGRG